MSGCSPDSAATQCLLGTPSDTEQTWAPIPFGSSCLKGGVLGLLKLADLSWPPLSPSKPTSYLLDGPESPRSRPSTLLPRNWAQRCYLQRAQGPEAHLSQAPQGSSLQGRQQGHEPTEAGVPPVTVTSLPVPRLSSVTSAQGHPNFQGAQPRWPCWTVASLVMFFPQPPGQSNS